MSTVITTTQSHSNHQSTIKQTKPTNHLGRLGMASGLVFVALFIYYGNITPSPPENFTNETLAAFYKLHVANIKVGTHLAAIAFLLFFVFAATLHNLVRKQANSDNYLPGVLLGSALMTSVIFIMGQASLAATALMASRDVNSDLVRGLDEISHITTHFFTAPLSIFLITTAVCIWLYRIMPRWMAIPNLLAGLTLIVTTGSFNHKELLHKIGVLALLLFLLSTLLMSCILLWQSRRAEKSL